MNNIEITKLDLVEGGNVFKQGHYLTLGYAPRDRSGQLVNLEGKDVAVSLYNRYGVSYETTARFDAGNLYFDVKTTIPSGEMFVEFTATDPNDESYRMKFPTNPNAAKLSVVPSTDDLGNNGITIYTVSKLLNEQKKVQQEYESTVDGKLSTVEQRLEDGIGAFTEDTEVLDARMGEVNLRAFNEKTTAQLAETDEHRHFESMINRKEPGLIATWIDDDGNRLVYSRFKEILKDYGIPLTSAIITNDLDASNKLTREQRDELSDLGMEFISHSHYHNVDKRLIDMTEEELEYDLKTSKQVMRELGYNYRGLALPFGDNSDLIQKVVKRHFDYVFGTTAGNFKNYLGELDNYYIWRINVDRGFDFVKEQVDDAVEKGAGWVVIVSHIFDESWYSDAYIRQIIDYILSKGIEFTSTQEGINRIGNIAQFGESKITAQGDLVNIGDLTVMKENESIYHYTSISQFKQNSITHTRIDASRSTGFPTATSGVLITHRHSDDFYSYQEFVTTGEKRYYVRYWHTGLSEWTDWINTNGAIVAEVNSIPSGRAAADYPIGIVMVYISGTGDRTGLPVVNSGTLTTYKPSSQIGRTYQEFKEYNNWNVSVRFEKTDGTWSEWRRNVTEPI